MRRSIFILFFLFPLAANSALVAKYSFEGNTSEGGTWSGTPGNYITGVQGLAAAFDGADDVLDLGAIHTIGTGDFSVALWAKFEESSHDQQMLSTGDQGTSGLVALTYANSGTTRIRLVTQEIIGGSHVSDNLYTIDGYPLGQWIHIVVTRSGSNGSIYIDGELQNSESDLRPGDLGSGNWRLGLGHQGAYFEGAIDELMVFDHALNQSDVDDILIPSQAIANLKLKEDPVNIGEVIAIAKGRVLEPPLGQAVSFDSTMTCPGFSATHSCVVDATTTTSVTQTANGVKMKCVYDTAGVIPEARIRLKSKNTVLEGDTCSVSITATSSGTTLLDADAESTLHE